MPRQSLQLNDFSGGLNTKSSPRDIAPNESQLVENVVISNPGLITAATVSTDKVSGSTTMKHIANGNGAFMFNSQFNIDTDGTATQPTQIIAYPINKDSGNTTIQFFRRNFDSTGVFTQEATNAEIDMQVTGEVEPVYYYVDGVLYISDKKIVDGDSDYEPRKLQYVSEDRFAQSITGWNNDKLRVVATDNMFEDISETSTGNFGSSDPSAAGEFRVLLSTNPSVTSSDLTAVTTNAGSAITTTANPGETAPSPNTDIGITDKSIFLTSAANTNLDTDILLNLPDENDGDQDFTNGQIIHINSEAMEIKGVSYIDNDGTKDVVQLIVQRDVYGTGALEHAALSPVFTQTSTSTTVTGGGWESGSYEFCHTVIDLQDNETLPQAPQSPVFNITDGSYFTRVGFRLKDTGFNTRKNEKGVRIYTRKKGGNGRWIMFLDVDYRRGVRSNLFEDYEEFTVADTNYMEVKNLDIVNPSLDTFESINGYTQEEESIVLATGTTDATAGGFKAAAVCARRAWIANVKKNGKVFDDRIYYTPVNRFATFPDSFYLDIGISDGDSFTALHSLGNRLLAFKQKKLYVINVSSTSDAGWYLEAEYDGMGCRQQESISKTPYGIAWVNDDGVYIFDGQSMPKELTIKLDDATWRTNQTGKNPAIGYNNKYKQLCVVQDTAADTDVFVFDFQTNSWSITKPIGNAGISNFLESFDGLYYLEYGGSHAKTLKLLTGDSNSSTTGDNLAIKLQTKDMDFGNPGLVKRIKKVYITAKDDGSGNTLTLRFGKDGASPDTTVAFNSSGAQAAESIASSNYKILSFGIGSATGGLNCESIALELVDADDEAITINDINIDFRLTNKRPDNL